METLCRGTPNRQVSRIHDGLEFFGKMDRPKFGTSRERSVPVRRQPPADDNSKSRLLLELQRLYDVRSRLAHTGWAEVGEYDAVSGDYAKECNGLTSSHEFELYNV